MSELSCDGRVRNKEAWARAGKGERAWRRESWFQFEQQEGATGSQVKETDRSLPIEGGATQFEQSGVQAASCTMTSRFCRVDLGSG